jgi:hypothetical protein
MPNDHGDHPRSSIRRCSFFSPSSLSSRPPITRPPVHLSPPPSRLAPCQVAREAGTEVETRNLGRVAAGAPRAPESLSLSLSLFPPPLLPPNDPLPGLNSGGDAIDTPSDALTRMAGTEVVIREGEARSASRIKGAEASTRASMTSLSSRFLALPCAAVSFHSTCKEGGKEREREREREMERERE